MSNPRMKTYLKERRQSSFPSDFSDRNAHDTAEEGTAAAEEVKDDVVIVVAGTELVNDVRELRRTMRSHPVNRRVMEGK